MKKKKKRYFIPMLCQDLCSGHQDSIVKKTNDMKISRRPPVAGPSKEQYFTSGQSNGTRDVLFG